MDELSRYIFNYCTELLTREENQAHRNLLVQQKIDLVQNERQKKLMSDRWLSHDECILGLLKNGNEEFYKKTIERVFRDHPNKEFLNLCPKCNALTKTPKAKQCPKCFHSWHDEVEK